LRYDTARSADRSNKVRDEVTRARANIGNRHPLGHLHGRDKAGRVLPTVARRVIPARRHGRRVGEAVVMGIAVYMPGGHRRSLLSPVLVVGVMGAAGEERDEDCGQRGSEHESQL
jgi:hypothetical protein